MGQGSSSNKVHDSIGGFVAPGYESVKVMFEENFRRGSDESSQLCVYVGEEMVVDLWSSSSLPSYSGDTLTNVFSSTKSVTSIAMACLVDQGLMEYSDKISKYWPEFAENEKGDITIADLMRHEAGLANITESLDVHDTLRENIKKNAVGEVIARQKCKSKEKREYHAISRGWIANEIFRRVHPEGKTIGEYLEAEISKPLDADVYVGVPASREEDYAPVKNFTMGKMIRESMKCGSRAIDLNFSQLLSLLNEFRKMEQEEEAKAFKDYKDVDMNDIGAMMNIDIVRRGESSSANGNCSARGLAKLGAAMANKGSFKGVKILGEKGWEALHADPTFFAMYEGWLPTNFTQGGVNKFEEEGGGGRDGYYGWYGYGGSVFEWNLEHKIGFAYTCTLLHWQDLFNDKGKRLQEEVVKCVKNLQK